MIRYRALKMRCCLPGIQSYCSYGLLAEENSNHGWRTVAIVPDVSCSESFVSALAETCTQGKLSPIHMLDVVEDSIS